MAYRYFLLASLLTLPACSSSSSEGPCPDLLPGAPDAGGPTTGCYAIPDLQICEQSGSGKSCSSACAGDEQSVRCTSADDVTPLPEPDHALGCKAVAMPTPPGADFYCCPCK